MLMGRQESVCVSSDLSQDVLLPHQFLPLSVGVGGDHRENVLAVVWHHAHKEDQILQELRHKPGRQTEALNAISVLSVSEPAEVTRGQRTFFHSGQCCRTEASSQSTPGLCWRHWQSPSL